MSDTIESVQATARLCVRCGEIGHDFDTCLRDASARDAYGTPVPVHPDDRFMRSRVDPRFSPHHQHQFPLELWQLTASYLGAREVIPHMPLVCKYFNDEVVWGKWSSALLWREMAYELVYKELSYDARPSLTVLMRACREGAPLAHVSILIAGRANVNAVDHNVDGTALHFACWKEREDIVRKLLEAKADPNIVAANGMTPLMVASFHGRASIATALLEHGANVNATRTGWTTLMWACDEGHVDVVRVLLDARADVNRTNDDGETALTLACGNNAIITMLVNAGGVSV